VSHRVVGETITVRSPATSANLGPGFDCLGLALDLWDEYSVTVTAEPGLRVDSVGEGADGLPRDASHLVARAMLAGLRHSGVKVPGVALHCRNTIPHGRGLGSSSAAIVGGLMLARGLAPQDALDDAAVVALANELEGHPDNVAPALLGAITIAWVDAGGVGRAVRAGTVLPVPITVLIPDSRTATEAARGLLPATIPYSSAVFNLGRTAMLLHALTSDPGLLLPATEDRLHQTYRASAYPQSLAAVADLRAQGLPAAISGAGPSVIVFSALDSYQGFRAQPLAVAEQGAHLIA
jgi:homoserine kinase